MDISIYISSADGDLRAVPVTDAGRLYLGGYGVVDATIDDDKLGGFILEAMERGLTIRCTG